MVVYYQQLPYNMKQTINIETDNEFKSTYVINGLEYFLYCKKENKDYPESLRYGWYLYFGKQDDNESVIYNLTNLNTPMSVLSGLGEAFNLFELKYSPDKISYITSERLSNLFKQLFFQDYQVFDNQIDLLNEINLVKKESKFYTLFK